MNFLKQRMLSAGRHGSAERAEDPSGYNMNFDTNIITVLPRRTLLEGYRRILATLDNPA
jgi:hypothetical protein